MRRALLIACLAGATVAHAQAPNAAALWEEATLRATAARYDEALPLFERAAQLGSVDAWFQVGFIHQFALASSKRDLDRAREAYGMAAARHHSMALRRLSLLEFAEAPKGSDTAHALQRMVDAVNAGDSDAAEDLRNHYATLGDRPTADRWAARAIALKLARQPLCADKSVIAKMEAALDDAYPAQYPSQTGRKVTEVQATKAHTDEAECDVYFLPDRAIWSFRVFSIGGKTYVFATSAPMQLLLMTMRITNPQSVAFHPTIGYYDFLELGSGQQSARPASPAATAGASAVPLFTGRTVDAKPTRSADDAKSATVPAPDAKRDDLRRTETPIAVVTPPASPRPIAGPEGALSSIDDATNTATVTLNGTPVRVMRPVIPWFVDKWSGLNTTQNGFGMWLAPRADGVLVFDVGADGRLVRPPIPISMTGLADFIRSKRADWELDQVQTRRRLQALPTSPS